MNERDTYRNYNEKKAGTKRNVGDRKGMAGIGRNGKQMDQPNWLYSWGRIVNRLAT